MSSIDLALLGLLKKRPMSAYEVNKYASSISLNRWVRMGSSTTYHNLKKLAAAGYLATKRVREGEMPEKTVYTLTREGDAHFVDLMRQIARNPGGLTFDFGAMVANLDLVDPETAAELLGELKAFFSEARRDIETHRQLTSIPRGARALVQLYQQLVATMNGWLEEQIAAYEATNDEADLPPPK